MSKFAVKSIVMNTLTFQTHLDSDTIHLKNPKDFIGKDVIVSIIEVPKKMESKKRVWGFTGAVKLNNQMDDKNIRDFANE